MFAYCLNNPANFLDSEGSSAICVTNGDRNPLLIGHIGLGGGGGGGYGGSGNSGYKDIIEEISDKTNKALGAIGAAAEDCWDAYMRAQNAQMQEAQLMLDGATGIYNYLDENKIISNIKWGANTVNAASHAKIAVAYLVAPIPTPADEYFAAWHAAKAMYCLVMAGISGMEALQ